MNINDWVYSYSKDLWQITRIINVDQLFPTKSNRALFICKRLLNAKGKRSFSMESAHQSFVKPLTASDKVTVDRFIAENPSVFKDFCAYHKPIDSILNLTFYVKAKAERNQFKKFIDDKFTNIKNGMTDEQIVEILSQSMNDRATSIRNLTVKFVSSDSEVLKNKFIYTRVNVLNF